jgi:hypothetical protein
MYGTGGLQRQQQRCPSRKPDQRQRNGFKRSAFSGPPCRWRVIGRYLFRPSAQFGMYGTVHLSGRHFRPDPGGHVMRLSSSFVAPSAVAILSTALLCGPSGTAMSQIGTGSVAPLPAVTVEAPRQVARPPARPQRPARAATTVSSRLTSPNLQTPWDGKGSALARLAALERTSSNYTDGHQTSFKYKNQPWNGCSVSGGIVPPPSPTCRNVRNYKTYEECRQTGLFLGGNNGGVWWYCTSLLAGGKLAGEKTQQVAELRRSGRR